MNTESMPDVYAICDVSLNDKLYHLSCDDKMFSIFYEHVDPLYPIYGASGEFIDEFIAIRSKEGMDILNQHGLGAAITDTRLFGKTWATLV